MKPIQTEEYICHICASLAFMYAMFYPGEELLETVMQQTNWILFKLFWVLVSISFEISLINVRAMREK